MFMRLRAALHMRDTKNRVKRHGWTAIYVGDYESMPCWAYSIGFHSSLGAPEVVVFDVPMATANGLFAEIYSDLKSGLVLRDGETWRPGESNHPLVWRAVHPSRLYDGDPENPWLGLAEDYAAIHAPRTGPIRAFQLVLTDGDGNLPWDRKYDEHLRLRQRALYLPVESPADTASIH